MRHLARQAGLAFAFSAAIAAAHTSGGSGGLATAAEVPEALLIPEQHRGATLTSELIGNPVLSEAGGTLGTLDGLLFDEEGRVNGAVISTGGLLGIGARRVGIAWEAFELRERVTGQISVYLDLTPEQIANAPEFRDRPTIKAERLMEGAAED